MIEVMNCLDYMADLESDYVDLVVTSPPYDDLRKYNGYSFEFEPIAQELFRIMKPGGVVVWVVNDGTKDGARSGTSFKQALYFASIGFNLHDVMIWQKPNYAPVFPSVKRYDQNFEYMFVLSKGTPKAWNPIKDKPKSQASINRLKYPITYIKPDGSRSEPKLVSDNSGMSKRTTIWSIPNGQKRGLKHPAVFPEQLAMDHISTWSNEGDLVFDPFVGSGTTGVAAKKLNRKFMGCEISGIYAEIAEQRIDAV
jgi:site-specific DNA-methyltransferase (adenine-specific)